MLFDLNETVRVKLTDHGRAIHKEAWSEICKAVRIPYRPPVEDAEGWSEWQLWSLMETFGSHIHLGGKNPFDTTIDLVEPKPETPPVDAMAAVRAMCR